MIARRQRPDRVASDTGKNKAGVARAPPPA